jgi:hypothetical protein
VGIALLPRRRPDDAIEVVVGVALAPALGGMRPAFERFQGELERVPTADPALRSGRAAWRVAVADFARVPPGVDVCATLERWQRARFARAEAPFGLESGFLASLVGETSPKLTRAARRMQQLGVRSGTARRFTGETLLDGIGDDVDFSIDLGP